MRLRFDQTSPELEGTQKIVLVGAGSELRPTDAGPATVLLSHGAVQCGALVERVEPGQPAVAFSCHQIAWQ